ncbi:MAG: DUF4232 domain-containing protein [Acidimicrobiales bacterium]
MRRLGAGSADRVARAGSRTETRHPIGRRLSGATVIVFLVAVVILAANVSRTAPGTRPVPSHPASAGCRPDALTVTNGPYVGGATQEEAHAILITNTSSTPCTLHGYVGIVAFDRRGAPLPFRLVRYATGGWPMATVVPPPFVVAPGRSGYVFFAQIACYTGYTATSRRIAVTLPDARTAQVLVLRVALDRCDGPSARIGNLIAESPIEPTLRATVGPIP